ncbi:proprotein convertase P-domain-containing protein [Streptomyces sp. DHE17-7]|uniref:proprotein convertase P-domain-containing protein n=1 Tax=Streptomyces sp. DHE17-7 TaxID=2759949 RepID=UPI003FA7BF87
MAVLRHDPHRTTRRRLAAVGAVATAALTASLVSALPAGAAPAAAEGRIQYQDAANAVAGSYIVTLKADEARSGTAEGRAVAKKYGADIERTYTKALNGYAVEASEAEAKRLAADPAVATSCQKPQPSRSPTPGPPSPTRRSWAGTHSTRAIPPAGSSVLPTLSAGAGQGVTAYVIDTGVRITHSDFGGRASNARRITTHTAQEARPAAHHVGQTVAGSAYGVAKQAKVVGVRVLDNSGSGTTAQVVAGIDWVARNAVKPAVANMSLGGGADSALDTAVRNAIASGVTFVVAAANVPLTPPPQSRPVDGSDHVGPRPRIDPAARSWTSSRPVPPSPRRGTAATRPPTPSPVRPWRARTSPGPPPCTWPTTPRPPPRRSPPRLTFRPHRASRLTASTRLAATAGCTVGDGGTTPPPTGDRFENTGDYTIRDNATVESPVTVSGVSGNAPSALSVEVKIVHSYIGDLQVQLVAPDGTAYTLKSYGTGGSADGIDTTYTVNASSETANGTWKLRVSDNASWDTGRIDAWALQF